MQGACCLHVWWSTSLQSRQLLTCRQVHATLWAMASSAGDHWPLTYKECMGQRAGMHLLAV